MFVKLCGLRTVEDARAAIDAGADALGFIFAESKRQVTPEFVAGLRSELPNPPTVVGVTVNRGAAELSLLFEDAKLDMIQLSGDEPIEILDALEMPVIKVLRFPEDTDINLATTTVDAWLSHRHAPELVFVEGHQAGAFGGVGAKANWRLLHEIAVRYPIVVGGGLDPDNVADAVRQVNPTGVDVSSGIETEGFKDAAKMQAFVSNARAAASQGYVIP